MFSTLAVSFKRVKKYSFAGEFLTNFLNAHKDNSFVIEKLCDKKLN